MMLPQDSRYFQRRIATAYVTTVISITLVLFLMGLLGMIILHAKKVSDYVKENIGFSIMIKEGVRESVALEFKQRLDRQPYVKTSEFIPKERAAHQLEEELGEDFISFLGYNPLLSSIDLRLKAPYTNPDSLRNIEDRLMVHPEVKEVFYQKSLVDMINRNIEKISLILLGFTAILLFIAVVLINNTIRLSIYSKRFLIRSMQLVGATEQFIRKPFLYKSMLHGFTSATIAIGLLIIMTYFLVEQLPELLELQDWTLLIILVVLIFLLGGFISWVSTWFSVRKYLRIKTDLLYT
jgi:cell division transport system permease protein